VTRLFLFACLFAFGMAICNAGEWWSEPRGQEYSLEHGERVLFWIPDEQPPQYGTVAYLWGYVPTIFGDDGRTRSFSRVQWVVGNL